MNKTWLTGLTIAGIAGSGGAAFAGVNAINSVSAESTPAAAATSAPSTRSVTYQIGVAGLVTIQSDGTTLTALDPHPGTGWTFVGSTSAAASHVEVQFTDGQQLVTFIADQVGSDIVVALTNVEAPGATTATAAPEPIVISIVGKPSSRQHPVGPAATPPKISLTSPTHHDDDDHEDEDHESEDHESEHDDD